MKKKIEELLPNIIKRISRGEAVSTVDIEKNHKISASSVRAHLSSLEKNFYKNFYKYDGSSKKWVAKEIGFLDKIILKPEEVVVLNAIKRNGQKAKGKLSNWYSDIVENYTKRASSFIFKQHNEESISEDMEQIFAQLHTAIDKKIKISLSYNKFKRIFYPYKVVKLEHYWYLLGYEESNEKGSLSEIVKTYKIIDIKYLELLKEKYKYDFHTIEQKLEHAINAYFSPSNPMDSVYLLVRESFSEYIDRAKLYSGWRKTEYTTTIQKINYIRYDVSITQPEFKEIIPTILQNMPNILVEDNQGLQTAVDNILKEYQAIMQN